MTIVVVVCLLDLNLACFHHLPGYLQGTPPNTLHTHRALLMSSTPIFPADRWAFRLLYVEIP